MANKLLQTITMTTDNRETTFSAQLTDFNGRRKDPMPVLEIKAGKGKFRTIYRDELAYMIDNVKDFAKALKAMDAAMTKPEPAPKAAPKAAPTTSASPFANWSPEQIAMLSPEQIAAMVGVPDPATQPATQPAEPAKPSTKSTKSMSSFVQSRSGK